MQESLGLPGWERKEGMMIRVLTQIVFRQVCAPKGGILDEPIGVKLRRGKGEKKAGRKGSDSAAHL